MKIALEPAIAKSNLRNLRKAKVKVSKNLVKLTKDTFDKSATEQSGKKILVSRKYPNWCDGEDTEYRNNTIATRVCYYPEDEKRMKNMSREQMCRYKDFLYDTGRYYEVESSGSLKEFNDFMRSLGLDPEEFYIKD